VAPALGKTFMASLVVDTLREENNSICTAFVYADYTESFQQTALSFLSCITRQLTTQYPDFMKLATKRFKDQIKRYRLQEADWLNTPTLSFDECFKLLQDFSAYDTHVFIIVDAVDEIRGIDEKSSTDIRFKLFQALAKLKYVSLFCTCRPNISASFFFDLFAEIHIEASDADLRTFLEARVTASRRLSDFISKSRTLQEEIVGTITKKASGMFLLARLQLDQLVSAITVRQVRQMLDKLSSQLFDMYDHTLQRIKQQSHVEAKLGIRAISWVAHTKRPMTISEFVQALSIENGDRSLDSSGVIDISIILEACAGLLHLQPASSDLEINGPFQKEETVQFVHYTTQEYILENQPDQYLSSHCDIANTCLTYLCFESFKMGASRYDYKSNCACVFRQTHPFLAYAAVFWPLHASISTSSLRYDLIKVLISPRFPWLSRNWLQFALRGTFQNTYTNIPPGFAAAALAIHGADNILKLLVGDGPFFKCKFLSTWTPLKIAILYGHQSCVDIIVSHGLEDNLEANRSWALGFLMDCYESEKLRIFHNSSDSNIDAMKKADHNAYEIILSAAGDVTRTELRRMTVPLFSKAILMGDETLAQRMLEAGWNARLAYSAFEVSASRGIGAWQETIYKVTGRMLKMMIDAGVDTNLRLADYNSPLNLAIRQQNEQMVSDLLLYGATSVSSGELSNLPLELAILLRNLPIVNQLLIHGAIVRDPFEKKTDPLWLALREYRFSRYSYYTERARVEALIINQLIEISWGCVITRKEYTSILTHAVNAGQFEAAQELVARYYQDCQGNNYKFPDEVLPLLSKLLRYGLPFSSSFIEFWSACKPGGIDILTMANRYGNIRLLEQILGGELEVNIPKGFRSPLMMAIRYHQQTPQSITWMRDQDLTANTGLTRLALECIIPRSEEAYQIIQLLIELYRSNLGTRTWCPSPWFSTNALLSISRLTDSFGINILKKALIRGVRPVGLNYEVCLILEKFSCLGRNMPQHIQAKSALITSALDIPMWGVSNALRNLDTSVYGDKSYEIQPPSHAECVEMQEWLLAIGPMEPTCPSPESKLVRHISAPALSTLFKCKGASEAEMEGSSKMHQHEQVSGGCEESDCERLKTKDHNRILALQLSGVI
jgi:ankyrin repeat protein